MRKAFAGLEMKRASITYTIGGSKKAKAASRELIIWNWVEPANPKLPT